MDYYITVDEFHKLREDTEALLEYVDGKVYILPPTSTKHQADYMRNYLIC